MSFELRPIPYDGAWPEIFRAEAQNIQSALSNLTFEIEHIGSTSIAGLNAKPILDILIELKSGDLSSLKAPLVQLGYDSKDEHGIPGRSYFSRKNSGPSIGVHIHAFKTGHPAIKKHIAFRDFLRAHPKVTKEYGRLKDHLLSLPDASRDNYQERKQPFIEEINSQAITWYEENATVLRNVRKAVVYAVRNSKGLEVLVFDQIKYPEASPQVPSGTIEINEDIFAGARRELHEESGIELSSDSLSLLGSYTMYKDHLKQFQERFVFLFDGRNLPDRWIHKVTGTGVDQNLEFEYYWMLVSEAKSRLQVNLGDGLEFFSEKITALKTST